MKVGEIFVVFLAQKHYYRKCVNVAQILGLPLLVHTQTQPFLDLANRLNTQGIVSECYTIPAYEHYGSLTDNRPADVNCLEAYLGPSPSHPGYSSYAIVQTFLPRYPSIALTLLKELRDTDKAPHPEPSKFSIEVDKKFSTIFLPTVYSAFNSLDPSGQNRSLLVQSYLSELTLSDFLQASGYTWKLLLRFKRDGQLAMIAVDYFDPLSTCIARVMGVTQKLFGGDIHLISRTPTSSDLKIPIRNPNGGYHLITDNSTALDKGFEIAISYLEKHYQTNGV
jgi:hypothetical protein